MPQRLLVLWRTQEFSRVSQILMDAVADFGTLPSPGPHPFDGLSNREQFYEAFFK
jgi:hypothetical protein